MAPLAVPQHDPVHAGVLECRSRHFASERAVAHVAVLRADAEARIETRLHVAHVQQSREHDGVELRRARQRRFARVQRRHQRRHGRARAVGFPVAAHKEPTHHAAHCSSTVSTRVARNDSCFHFCRLFRKESLVTIRRAVRRGNLRRPFVHCRSRRRIWRGSRRSWTAPAVRRLNSASFGRSLTTPR
jgi:hypothetical protein